MATGGWRPAGLAKLQLLQQWPHENGVYEFVMMMRGDETTVAWAGGGWLATGGWRPAGPIKDIKSKI